MLAVRHLPESRFGRWLVLDSAVRAGASDQTLAENAGLVGLEGKALTALHPSGRVEVLGKRYDAVAELGFVEAGSEIVVRQAKGFSLVVKAAVHADKTQGDAE